jgi:transposase
LTADLSDGEWAILVPLIPAAQRGGRPRDVDIRAAIGALRDALATGYPWCDLPKEVPPKEHDAQLTSQGPCP